MTISRVNNGSAHRVAVRDHRRASLADPSQPQPLTSAALHAMIADIHNREKFNPNNKTQIKIPEGKDHVDTTNVPAANVDEAQTYMKQHDAAKDGFCLNSDGTIDGGKMLAYAQGRIDGATQAEIGVAKFYCNPDHSGEKLMADYRAPWSKVPVQSSSVDLTGNEVHKLNGKPSYDVTNIVPASSDDANAYMNAHPDFCTRTTGPKDKPFSVIDDGKMYRIAAGGEDGATTEQIAVAKHFTHTPEGQANMYMAGRAGHTLPELGETAISVIPASNEQTRAYMEGPGSAQFRQYVSDHSSDPLHRTTLLQDYADGKIEGAKVEEIAAAKGLLRFNYPAEMDKYFNVPA